MRQMTKTSVRLSSFIGRTVCITEAPYTFKPKRSAKEVTQQKIECYVLGDDPRYYVQAVAKGSMTDLSNIRKQMVDGAVFQFSKIKLALEDSQYISSPIKILIDLRNQTTMTKITDEKVQNSLAKKPVPPRTVAETSQITATSHQDLLALVTAIDSTRSTKRGDVLEVTVMDGSQYAPGSYAQLKIAIWGSEKQKMLAVGKPLMFLKVNCKIDGNNKQYASWEDAFICEAPDCEKTTLLLAEAEKLRGATNVTMLSHFTPKASVIDVSGPQSLSACALLQYTVQNPQANYIPEVHQLMCCSLEEPSGGSVTPEGKENIWFLTSLRDFSGSIQVAVKEKLALDLTGLDREAFKAAFDDGSLQFPLLLDVKVHRRITQDNSSDRVFVNPVLEQAEQITWNNSQGPNSSYENILKMLNALPKNEDGVLYGYLSDIEEDPYSGFRLKFPNGTVSKGNTVAVLVASQKCNKNPEKFGDGYYICAPEVRDEANDNAAEVTYSLTGYCGVNDMSKFELKPGRGQPCKYAIVFITKCQLIDTGDAAEPKRKSFEMDKIQILEPGKAMAAKSVFQKLRRLTNRLDSSNQDEPKRDLEVNPDDLPFSKARKLQQWPTGESLVDAEKLPQAGA